MLSAKEANATLPKMLDANTRFDSVTVRPAKVMRYHYTLVNKDVSNVDIRSVESVLRKQIVDKLNAAKDLAYFKKNHVTFIYVFNKENGDMIFDLKIAPGEYK